MPWADERLDDLALRLVRRATVERPGVDQPAVVVDHGDDRQLEALRELAVTFVVGRHRHDRAGAVLHQHVVGDPDRDLLAGHGVRRVPPGEDARLLALLALLGGARAGDARVRTHLLGAGQALGQLVDERRLGRDHEEGRTEERVRPGGEHRDVELELVHPEENLGALGATDPVRLDLLRPLRPVDRRQIVEQRVGVGRDLEEPLRHVADLDDRVAAPTPAVDDVLVREHRLVVRAPVDRRLLAVGEPVLEELQEEPLRPPVVRRLVRRDLAVPVDRPPHPAHLLDDRRDVALGDLERAAALLDRRVLRRQPERVEAHRAQHRVPGATAEVRDHVAERVVQHVPHVQASGRIREHLEHVEMAVVRRRRLRVLDREGALRVPDGLPLPLDCVCVVLVHRLPLLGAVSQRRKSLSRERPWGAHRGSAASAPWLR